MKKLLLFICIFYCSQTIAQTVIPEGSVSGIWTKSGSPYLVSGDIIVVEGESLTIEPGVEVNFQDSYKFHVNGRLVAKGNAVDSIIFTANNISTGWQGISFYSVPPSTDSSLFKFCRIEYANKSGANGGGISITNVSKISIANSSIRNCSTTGFGGAIYSWDSNLKITDCSITNNHSQCGAIFASGLSFISNNYIANNDNVSVSGAPPIVINPDYTSGGLWVSGENATIINNIITNNSSIGNAGGISITGNAELYSNVITNNLANVTGGGVYAVDCSRLEKNIIDNNTATSCGGLYFYRNDDIDLSPFINGNTIINNKSQFLCGGAYFFGTNQISVTKNKICNNTCTSSSGPSDGAGGMLFINTNLNSIVADNVVCNNKGANGGGILLYGAFPAFTNNTISNNQATLKGGGLYFYSCSPNFYNNIIWGNTAPTNGGNQVFLLNESSDPNFYYNDVEGTNTAFAKNGTFYLGKYLNNTNNNPRFVGPTAGSGNTFDGVLADWGLQDTSRCINIGTPAINPDPITDFFNNQRIISCRIDMGAIENQVRVTPASSTNFAINDFPFAAFEYKPWTSCKDSVIFSAGSNYNGIEYNIYNWNTGDITSTVTAKSDGWYRVRVTDTAGCSASDSTYLSLKPVANFTISKDTQCLKGNQFIFTNNSLIGLGTASYKWSFGDGVTDTIINTSHVYTTAGSFNVKLVITKNNGCKDSLTKKIVVSNIVFNPFTDTLKICGDNTTLNPGSGFATYLWNNGSTNQNLTVSSDGWYKVIVSNSLGCTATDSSFISLRSKAIFTISKDTQCLSGNNFLFTNLTTPGSGSFTSKWSFGDGTIDTTTNISHTYTAAGSYNVKLVISKSNGCKDSLIKTIQVININFNPFADTTKICNNNTLINPGSGFASYLWSTGNTTQKITVINDGWYKVTVTNNIGCVASDSSFISLKPIANFDISKDTQCLNGNNFTFTNKSFSDIGAITSKWFFGDGTTDTTTNISHTYTTAGSFTVKLVVTKNNGCKDSLSRVIRVNNLIINPFADTLKIIDDTTVLDAGAGYTSYLWNTGSNSRFITVKTNGWYTVTVTNVNDCSATDSTYIFFKKPSTLFVDKIETICPGSNVNISLRSKNFTNIVGIQGTITWDISRLTFKNVTYDNAPVNITVNNLNLNNASNGYLTFSWLDNSLTGKSTIDSSKLFTINFDTKVSSPGYQTFINLTSSVTPLEIDTLNLLTQAIEKTSNTNFINGYVKIAALAKDSYVTMEACDSVIYKDSIYRQSTVIIDTLKYIQGCDSVYKHITISIVTSSTIPTIQIVASSQSINYGNAVSFTASITHGGTNPVIQWYKNGVAINGSTGYYYSTTTLNTTDTIQAMLTSSFLCTAPNIVFSNKIALNIYYQVSGKINNPLGKVIPYTTIKIDNNSPTNINSQNFNATLLGGQPHVIKVSKTSDVNKINGVSTLDIALIQSHILDINKLNNPLKIIAADVDNSGSVTALDILHIQRLVLGITTSFPNSRLWAFVDSTNIDPTNPFPIKDSILIDTLLSNKNTLQFIGVKLGDVNFDWNSALLRPSLVSPVIFYHDDVTESENNEIRIPLKVKNFKDLIAMQYTLNFNPKALEFNRIEKNILNIKFASNKLTEGLIPFLWNDSKNNLNSFEDGSILMELVFNKKTDFKEEILNISSDISTIEALDGDLHNHFIVKNSGKIIGKSSKEIWSVLHNPTKENIILSVSLLSNKQIQFILQDVTGKVVANYSKKLFLGNNTINLNIHQDKHLAKGVYYLKANGIENADVKKIIIE